MNRQQLKDIAEGIGFIAIIASLVFVGIESRNSTRQSALNTQALEIAAYQALMTNIDELNQLSLQSPAAAATMMRIWPDESDIADEFHKDRVMFILFRHGDLAYFMYERGVIDESRLASALTPVPIFTKLGREFWELQKGAFTADYRDYIDQLIADKASDKTQE